MQSHLRTLAAGEDVEVIHNILVFREDAVVVEVDIATRSAHAACQDAEEVGHILIFGEDAVVVEVDGVARGLGAVGGYGDFAQSHKGILACFDIAVTCERRGHLLGCHERAVVGCCIRTHSQAHKLGQRSICGKT